MTTGDNTPDRSSRGLIALTVAWAVTLAYLLLTSSPPDIGPVSLRSLEDPGHLVGSLLLSFLLFLVLARRIRTGWAVAAALTLTFAYLLALELIQEVRPGRGYQRFDIELNVGGAVLGVALAWAFSRWRTRRNSVEGTRSSPGDRA